MTIFTPIRRGLGAHTASTPPTPPSDNYRDLLAGISGGPTSLFEFDDTAASETLDNAVAGGTDGAYVLPARFNYRLTSLISGEPTGGGGMRSVAFNGSITEPAHCTVTDLVTGADYTIDVGIQLDRLPGTGAKYILITQGLSGSTAGATSMEILGDGRIRWWTSVGGSAKFLDTTQALPAGEGVKLTFRQEDGVGRFVYINGVLATGGSDTTNTDLDAPPTGTWYIGAWSDGAAPYNGMMCMLAAWATTAISEGNILLLGLRAQSALELQAFSKTLAANSSGSFDVSTETAANPEAGWTVEVTFTPSAALTAFSADGTTISWTTGPAGTPSPQPTVRLVKGSIQSASRQITISVVGGGGTDPPTDGLLQQPAGRPIVVVPGGTLETSYICAAGGATIYDMSNRINRRRWTGAQGCTVSGGARSDVTGDRMPIEVNVSHNGGGIARLRFYSNIDRHNNYDKDSINNNVALYPCSHFGVIYGPRESVVPPDMRNFTIEECNIYGGWDCFRYHMNKTETNTEYRPLIRRCLIRNCRDDVIELDSGAWFEMEDCLIGDEINAAEPFDSGCWAFYSSTQSSTDLKSRICIVRRCMIWMRHMRANRVRAVDGYCSAAIVKAATNFCPRVRWIDCVIMADGFNISTANGDPLWSVRESIASSGNSGNVFIWRGGGNYGPGIFPSTANGQGTLPPGFTVMNGTAGENFWNQRARELKNGPLANVPRFRDISVPRLNGGTLTLHEPLAGENW